MYNPVKTLKTNTIGTINVLGLARRVKARVLLASSSVCGLFFLFLILLFTFKMFSIGLLNIFCLFFCPFKEVYGDPELNPQPESYLGRVNTVGPRACYDEGKRAAEALMVAFHKQVVFTLLFIFFVNLFIFYFL
jgi:UDP-glucuronate decarboxylase